MIHFHYSSLLLFYVCIHWKAARLMAQTSIASILWCIYSLLLIFSESPMFGCYHYFWCWYYFCLLFVLSCRSILPSIRKAGPHPCRSLYKFKGVWSETCEKGDFCRNILYCILCINMNTYLNSWFKILSMQLFVMPILSIYCWLSSTSGFK